MAGTIHIGEVAERTGLSLRTLRHYDDVGLVKPSDRTDAGYRLYTDADVERILLIRRMKPLGFSLDQMGEVLTASAALAKDPSDATARAALDSFVADAEQRREKLAAQLEAAEELIERLASPLQPPANRAASGRVHDGTRA
ncbi:MerR family transcriptional regulator [Microbacterium faecale]|uniref:MerR family transcriptional regulator n=1 Tax=Microbacterium faecale TaxID=1804630 RepID=A0A917DK51_9MICO|nr:MerR family transcriptional regulator [Microbacterium faecale]GGD45036.1 MerR family transcriptional regulator [Microbacterium faecale]